MHVQATEWTLERKRVRSRPDLRPLLMLFSVSGNVGQPRVTDQDRFHYAHPYRLTVTGVAGAAGRYQLTGLKGAADLLDSLEGRAWQLTPGRGRRSATLTTDLSEYERVLWEALAQQGPPGLQLSALPAGS
ncbi:hypothetical protein [Deinococcus sonorensis]|uniref:Uncharacterized protein n=2 Tax=Deinococcus sonorensis TaxID=309891 RepID=A0AAU7U7P2_9DEIO